MLDASHINVYVRSAWIILEGKSVRCEPYEQYLANLINTCQFSLQNLVISLYFLHKYSKNQVNSVGKESNLSIYLVLTSLVLSNKTFDDQSYTLKTWNNICNGITTNTATTTAANCDNTHEVKIDFKLLKSLEIHFLSCLNYSLSFLQIDKDSAFWDNLKSIGAEWMQILQRSVCSNAATAAATTTTNTTIPTKAICPSTPAQGCMPPAVPAAAVAVAAAAPSWQYTPDISNLTTPSSSKLYVSPIETPINHTAISNTYLSPLTSITPYTEPHHNKRFKCAPNSYKPMHTAPPPAPFHTFAAPTQEFLQPPYIVGTSQFTFQYKPQTLNNGWLPAKFESFPSCI